MYLQDLACVLGAAKMIFVLDGLLASILGIAGASKLLKFSSWRLTALNYESFLPRWSISSLTWALPVLELATAGAVLSSRTRDSGRLLAGLLFSMFGAVAVYLRLRGRAMPQCSCLGGVGELHKPVTVSIFDSVLGVAAIAAAFAHNVSLRPILLVQGVVAGFLYWAAVLCLSYSSVIRTELRARMGVI